MIEPSWGAAGLVETLDTLDAAGLRHAGAGRTSATAEAPAVVDLAGQGRVLVFAFAMPSSGTPPGWAATETRSGINFLPDLSGPAIAKVVRSIAAARRPHDLVVASIHWGANWGYEVTDGAKALVDQAGVGIVHGHSAHHPKGIEVHHDRLILYGCGDFINDYEGIGGYEAYRDDLRLMYFATLARHDGRLLRLEMSPLEVDKMHLQRASGGDIAWLSDLLNREGRRLGSGVVATPQGTLDLRWR